MKMREIIRQILIENKLPAILDTSIEEIKETIVTSDLSADGYNVLSVTREVDSTADLVFTVVLQHVKPDFAN